MVLFQTGTFAAACSLYGLPEHLTLQRKVLIALFTLMMALPLQTTMTENTHATA
jgi:hypothetical protein